MKFVNLILGALLCVFFCFLIGCSTSKENVVIYNNINNHIKNSFLENNRVKGAYYKNPEYIEGESLLSERYFKDNSSPEKRTFIILDEETFSSIFENKFLEVNFEKEMLVLYIFADTYPNREYFIQDYFFENQNLFICLKNNKNNKADVTAPFQRCLLIKMERSNALQVEFKIE